MPEIDKCPKCSCDELHRDSVNVGVGVIDGPWGCPQCGWSEDSEYDLSDGRDPVDAEGGAIDQFGGYHPPGSSMALAYRLAKMGEEEAMQLSVDRARWENRRANRYSHRLSVRAPECETGILVRASLTKADGTAKWDSFDIYYLEKASLLTWLKSRGGENKWAEDVVGILLGHGALHDHPKA